MKIRWASVRLPVLVAFIGIVGVGVVAVLARQWGSLQAGQATVIAAVIAAAGALGAAGLAFYREHLNRRGETERSIQQRDDQRTEALRARTAAANHQLTDSSAAIRLQGVCALIALADEWQAINDDERHVCIRQLCAYLVRSPKADLDADEKEARQTIVKTIAERTQLPVEDVRSWAGVDTNVRGAVLRGLEFCGADLKTANLELAAREKAPYTLRIRAWLYGHEPPTPLAAEMRLCPAQPAATPAE